MGRLQEALKAIRQWTPDVPIGFRRKVLLLTGGHEVIASRERSKQLKDQLLL